MPWPVAAVLSLCIHLQCPGFLLCVSVSLDPNFLLLIRTPVVLDSGPTLNQYKLILTCLHLQRLFPNRSHSQVQGRHHFWGDTLQAATGEMQILSAIRGGQVWKG